MSVHYTGHVRPLDGARSPTGRPCPVFGGRTCPLCTLCICDPDIAISRATCVCIMHHSVDKKIVILQVSNMVNIHEAILVKNHLFSIGKKLLLDPKKCQLTVLIWIFPGRSCAVHVWCIKWWRILWRHLYCEKPKCKEKKLNGRTCPEGERAPVSPIYD